MFNYLFTLFLGFQTLMHLNFFYIKNTAFLIAVIYFLINMFFLFFSVYSRSKYSSFVKQSWQRSFILFWIIEFYLFFIFIFVFFVCPDESNYFFNYLNSCKFSWVNFDENYMTLLYVSVVCFLTNLTLLLKKKNKVFFYLIWGTSSLFFYFFSLKEFFILKDSVLELSNLFFKHEKGFFSFNFKETNVVSVTSFSGFFIQKPNISLYLVLNLIKFLHFFFILFFFFIFSLKFFNNVSKENISLVSVHLVYVILFYLTSIVLLFKCFLFFFFLKKYSFTFDGDFCNFLFCFCKESLPNIV